MGIHNVELAKEGPSEAFLRQFQTLANNPAVESLHATFDCDADLSVIGVTMVGDGVQKHVTQEMLVESIACLTGEDVTKTCPAYNRKDL